jgi:hypothetical protein
MLQCHQDHLVRRPVPVHGEPEHPGVRTAVMPQTLGDRLDEAMRVRQHDTATAARVLGVSTSEVLLWMHDMQTPDPDQCEPLLDYLVVEDRHLRGLILRSQMRRLQMRIRS